MYNIKRYAYLQKGNLVPMVASKTATVAPKTLSESLMAIHAKYRQKPGKNSKSWMLL